MCHGHQKTKLSSGTEQFCASPLAPRHCCDRVKRARRQWARTPSCQHLVSGMLAAAAPPPQLPCSCDLNGASETGTLAEPGGARNQNTYILISRYLQRPNHYSRFYSRHTILCPGSSLLAPEPPSDKERYHNCGTIADNSESFLKRFNYFNCRKGDNTFKSLLHHKLLFRCCCFIRDPLVLPSFRVMAIEHGENNY